MREKNRRLSDQAALQAAQLERLEKEMKDELILARQEHEDAQGALEQKVERERKWRERHQSAAERWKTHLTKKLAIAREESSEKSAELDHAISEQHDLEERLRQVTEELSTLQASIVVPRKTYSKVWCIFTTCTMHAILCRAI